MSNVSELCRQCEIGWASASETETCDQCPERNTTIALFVMAVIGTFCLFSYLVSDSIDGAHEMIKTKESMPFHSISIRIVSSYLQVSSMLLAFDVTLPKSVRTLMYVQASTSSLSEQFLRFDCLTNVRADGVSFNSFTDSYHNTAVDLY